MVLAAVSDERGHLITIVPPCSSAAATGAAVLDATAILAERPTGAELVDQPAATISAG
ncbi:hypothetical protein [Actinoplanes cyaneus]|uniref:hypothetical protein n=1 Tax=Actinoplanes cyaneus TaxID=52696 RepID=UPI001940A0C5|nr:hypothetical protein [Actinoplanes cyaneus]